MDYWTDTMAIRLGLPSLMRASVGGRVPSLAKSRQVKNKDGKLVWPEKRMILKQGKRRFKSDLLPARDLDCLLLHCRTRCYWCFSGSRTHQLSNNSSTKSEMRKAERKACLAEEVIEGEGEKQKITAKIREGPPQRNRQRPGLRRRTPSS